MARGIIVPQRCPGATPCYSEHKKDFADGIHFKIWDEEMIPDFLERPTVVTRVPVRGRQEGRVTEQMTEVVQGGAPM